MISKYKSARSEAAQRTPQPEFGLIETGVLGALMDKARALRTRIGARIDQLSDRLEDGTSPLDQLHFELTDLLDLTRFAAIEVAEDRDKELTLPATLLINDQPELYAEVDRLKAEGDLRTSVAFPLLALAVLFCVGFSPLCVVAVIAPVVLFYQGMVRLNQSRQTVSDAMQLGRITSPSVERFGATLAELETEFERLSAQHFLGPPSTAS